MRCERTSKMRFRFCVEGVGGDASHILFQKRMGKPVGVQVSPRAQQRLPIMQQLLKCGYQTMKEISPKLGQNLKRIRTKKKMSQGDIARALEVHRASVSGIETGKRILPLRQ